MSDYAGPLPILTTQPTVTVNDPECLAADAELGALSSGLVVQGTSIPYFTMVLADGTVLDGPADPAYPGVVLTLSDGNSSPPSNICAPGYQNQIVVTMGP